MLRLRSRATSSTNQASERRLGGGSISAATGKHSRSLSRDGAKVSLSDVSSSLYQLNVYSTATTTLSLLRRLQEFHLHHFYVIWHHRHRCSCRSTRYHRVQPHRGRPMRTFVVNVTVPLLVIILSKLLMNVPHRVVMMTIV